MVKNQLFRVLPNDEFIENVLKLFVPKGYDEYYQFSRQSIVEKNIVKKLKIPYFNKIFKEIYLPCKYKLYIEKLTTRKCVTILRQLLKIKDYNIIGTEKYINHKKILLYNIKKIEKVKKKKNIQSYFKI